MHINEIQERADAIRAAMTAKGLPEADASFRINSDAGNQLWLRWHPAYKASYEYEYETFKDESADVMLGKAMDFIRSLPDAEEARKREFLTALGKVIDLGKDRGIDVDFLNPLTATMKRLSENIITDQRAA